jgi:hypothetical protein
MRIEFIGEGKRSVGSLVRTALLLTALFTAGFLAGRFALPQAQPGSGRQVTVNLTEQQRKATDWHVQERLTGHGRSFFPTPPQKQDRSKGEDAVAPTGDGFAPGHSEQQPFTGEIHASFIGDDGAILGEGSFPVNGVTTATWTEAGLQIGTTFTGEPEIALTLPKPRPKRYEIGLAAGVGANGQTLVGGYGRLDLAVWNLGSLEITPWLGLTGLNDGNGLSGYLLVGTGVRF